MLTACRLPKMSGWKNYDYLFSKDKLQRCQNHSSVLLMNCRKCFGGCTEGGGFHNNLGSCELIQKFPVTEILQSVFKVLGLVFFFLVCVFVVVCLFCCLFVLLFHLEILMSGILQGLYLDYLIVSLVRE